MSLAFYVRNCASYSSFIWPRLDAWLGDEVTKFYLKKKEVICLFHFKNKNDKIIICCDIVKMFSLEIY